MATIHQRPHHRSNNNWQQNDQSMRGWEVCEIPMEEDEEGDDILQSSNSTTVLTMESVGEQEEEDVDSSSSMSSSPSIPDENINFDLVYALHTFVATVEGQASVVKGDALILMEDTNIYWWLVEVLKTREVGYIPAENIETPYERLARLNKHRNVDITSPNLMDGDGGPSTSLPPLGVQPKKLKNVTIASDVATRVIHYVVESDEDEDEDDHDHYMDGQDIDDDNDEFHDTQEISQDMDKGNDDNDDCDAITMAPDQPTSSYHHHTAAMATVAVAVDMTSEPLEPLRVFAGSIGQDAPLFHTFSIRLSTTADELVKEAMDRFALDRQRHPMATDGTLTEYYISVQGQDGDNYVLGPQDKPLSIFKTLTAPLTTPMPSVSHIKQSPLTPTPTTATATATPSSSSSRRQRSSSFSNYEQTSYGEDSVIRFYLHRRIKRAHEREGIFYIKVSLYPDDGTGNDTTTPTAVTPSGKKKRVHPPRQEIDRIDKIMAVKLEQQIGSVITMALEKFHVPDAEPDYPLNAQPLPLLGPTDRCLTKYCMSVRCTSSSRVETPLDPRDHMATALHHQNKAASPVVTSDLLFILRRADAPIHRQFQQKQQNGSSSSSNSHRRSQAPPILAPIDPSHHHHPENGHESAERRPSILDILMDSPRSADNRVSGYLNPATGTFDDSRRPSFPSSLASQECKSSLTPSYHSGIPTSVTMPGVGSGDFAAPHSPSTGSLSPPTAGFRRTSVMSTSNISATSSGYSDYCDTTNITANTTADMNHRTSSSASHPAAGKKENSLRQQLKRLVGWGGSGNGSNKSKKNTSQPQPLQQQPLQQQPLQQQPLQQQPLQQQSLQQQSLQQPSLHAVAGASAVSLVQQNNDSALSVKYQTAAASSSQVSLVSSPPTPLTPTPQHAKSLPSRASSPSKPPTPITSNTPFSPGPGSPAPSSSQILLPNESTVSSNTSSLCSVDDKEPIDLSDDSDDDDDEEDKDENDEEAEEDKQSNMTTVTGRNKELPSKSPHQQNGGGGEMNDIQAQYTRWMDIQEQDHTKRVSKVEYTESSLPLLPTSTMSPPPSTLSTCSTTSHQQHQQHSSVITDTSAAAAAASLQQQQQQQQTVPSSKEAGIDDLFFLVTRGVDYLQSRESSKWDDEGGYQFHPWNRSDGSFVIRKKPEVATPLHDIIFDHDNATGAVDPLAAAPASHGVMSEGDVVMAAATAAVTLTDGCSSSISGMTSTSSVPPVRSNSTSSSIQQQQQKHGVVVPPSSKPASIRQSPPAAQNEACIDEQELQRIVAAHIVF